METSPATQSKPESEQNGTEPVIESTTEPAPQPLDPEERKKLQAMIGNPKEQQGKFFVGEKDQKKTISDHPAQATIYIKNCQDSEYIIDSYCTKVLIESCTNCKVYLNSKIITNTVDVWKCKDSTVHINTHVGTLQSDNNSKVQFIYGKKEHLLTLVWANCHDIQLKMLEEPIYDMETGFAHMKKEYPNIKEDLDQFIVRFVDGKLLSEQIVRLVNGFPTTEREAKEFDKRQEENLKKLAENLGITMGRKKREGPKLKPNDMCYCASGKKYKKCHGTGK